MTDRINAEIATVAADLGLDAAKVRRELGDRARDHDGDILVDGETKLRDHLAMLAAHRPDLRPEPDLATMSQADYERRRREGWQPPRQPDPGRKPVELTAKQRQIGAMDQPTFERARRAGQI